MTEKNQKPDERERERDPFRDMEQYAAYEKMLRNAEAVTKSENPAPPERERERERD